MGFVNATTRAGSRILNVVHMTQDKENSLRAILASKDNAPMSRLFRNAALLALSAALAAPLACSQEKAPAATGNFRMTVLGLKLHGLAVVLQTPSGAVYVVDTGKKEDGDDAGQDSIAPFLKVRRIEEIAGIVVSHPHRDHFEGAAYLLKHFRVKRSTV